MSQMLDFDLETDTRSNPLDRIERMATRQEWEFERDSENEISVAVEGRWSDYQIAITWLTEVETLHVACAFDLKVPPQRRAEILALIALVNEQLWVGHFDLWSGENVVMFRHAMLLSGGAQPSEEQVAAMIGAAADSCERYYQSFQFVVWAGKSAREALEGALMETVGEA
jgi:hypothetical protein